LSSLRTSLSSGTAIGAGDKLAAQWHDRIGMTEFDHSFRPISYYA